MAQKLRSRFAYGSAMIALFAVVAFAAGNWTNAIAAKRTRVDTVVFAVTQVPASTAELTAITDSGDAGSETITCTRKDGSRFSIGWMTTGFGFDGSSKRRVLGRNSGVNPPPGGGEMKMRSGTKIAAGTKCTGFKTDTSLSCQTGWTAVVASCTP